MFEVEKQLNDGNKPHVGLTFSPQDFGGCPKINYFDGRYDKLHEKKEQHEIYSEIQTISPARIVENERIRNIIDPYLEDVLQIGWENLSDEELNDVVLNSIVGHNSIVEINSWHRARYKAHFRDWKKYGKRLKNNVANQPDDELIGKDINGVIPLCICSARGYREQTIYYCRDTITKWLVRIKYSALKKLVNAKDVNEVGLDLDSEYSDDVVG
ncbi:MAG: hypothetical protein E7304_12860 [Butyrivibrio sp.]|uniref:hypothetical protein n=1 Tax=Butyrivibrio sp. TaxID=28121 RepID=UPI001EC42F95|nr:hypothetical protein [Butyrivibrio sp.]MBE5842279.1 hypothetical protein [Butyrivibrio sp.]